MYVYPRESVLCLWVLERRSVLKLQSHFSFLLQRFVIDLDESRILQRLQQYESRSDRKGKHPRHLQYIQYIQQLSITLHYLHTYSKLALKIVEKYLLRPLLSSDKTHWNNP